MYKTILVPVDIAHIAEGKLTIDLAVAHASDETRIVLLNVIEEIPGWASVAIPTEIIEKSTTDAQSELKAVVNASGRKMDVLVRTGHSYSTILDVAEETNADLIIIASHRPGLQDYFLGSTAAKVVRHAPCSVLVVR
ncbi:MAG: universal stress protein [Gammaproteobacteria bacterium]|nr:universal stress protein [Gammaproteobacteria bacterium]